MSDHILEPVIFIIWIAGLTLIIGIGLILFDPDDRPIKCFEGFSYKIDSDGAMHLQKSGKFSTPVRCQS
jgi:hypothetical protein